MKPTLEQGKSSWIEALHSGKQVNSQRRQQSLTYMCLTKECQKKKITDTKNHVNSKEKLSH